jgi:hypothetical protein
MDISNSLFGPCTHPEFTDGEDFFDLQSFINKLLLFDRFILDSPNLYEIPHIVKAFGFEGTLRLLSSGALRISCELRISAQIAQSGFLAPGGTSHPLNNYSISYGYAHNRDKWVSDQLKNVGTSELNNRQIKQLKLSVVGAIEKKYLQDLDQELRQQSYSDLGNNRGLKLATALTLKKEKKIEADLSSFSLQLHQIGENHFRAESSIEKEFSLDEVEVHKIIEKAVLGVAALNQRIFEMKVHKSLSGFLESETPLFGDRLDFLMQACDPNRAEEKLDRVLKLRNFPGVRLDYDTKVDIEKLLEVRKSRELIEFREWLKKIDTASDAEILDQLNSIRSKLGIGVQNSLGKTVRLAVSTVAGLVPGVGPILGLALGTADTFLLEQVLPYPGAVAFVDKLYPSIFQRQ